MNTVTLGNTLRTGLLVACTAAGLGAQTITAITGTVKSAGSNAAIAGATIKLATDTTVTTTSGADGAFTLTLPIPIGVLEDGRRVQALAFNGSELTFAVGEAGAPVRVEMFDLRGNSVKTLHNARLASGQYAMGVAPTGIAAGVYFVRAQVGSVARTFKVSSPSAAGSQGLRLLSAGSAGAKGLAKRSSDFLMVSAEGYLKKSHILADLAAAQNVVLSINAAATTNMKIFSDQAFPEIDWAIGVIYSWSQTAVLLTDSTNNTGHTAGAKTSMAISTAEGQLWNGWGFHVTKQDDNGTQPTVDLTPYKDGAMHLAVKGTMPGIGVMMSSYNQNQGQAPLVDLSTKGYLPDGQWHEITIPLSDFDNGSSLDFANIFVYAGFVAPVTQGGTFDPLATYTVDEIYFTPTK